MQSRPTTTPFQIGWFAERGVAPAQGAAKVRECGPDGARFHLVEDLHLLARQVPKSEGNHGDPGVIRGAPQCFDKVLPAGFGGGVSWMNTQIL